MSYAERLKEHKARSTRRDILRTVAATEPIGIMVEVTDAHLDMQALGLLFVGRRPAEDGRRRIRCTSHGLRVARQLGGEAVEG